LVVRLVMAFVLGAGTALVSRVGGGLVSAVATRLVPAPVAMFVLSVALVLNWGRGARRSAVCPAMACNWL